MNSYVFNDLFHADYVFLLWLFVSVIDCYDFYELLCELFDIWSVVSVFVVALGSLKPGIVVIVDAVLLIGVVVTVCVKVISPVT